MPSLQRGLGSVGVGWFCSGRGAQITGRGLLRLIAAVEPQDHGPAPPLS
jgi:hypothetical protein